MDKKDFLLNVKDLFAEGKISSEACKALIDNADEILSESHQFRIKVTKTLVTEIVVEATSREKARELALSPEIIETAEWENAHPTYYIERVTRVTD